MFACASMHKWCRCDAGPKGVRGQGRQALPNLSVRRPPARAPIESRCRWAPGPAARRTSSTTALASASGRFVDSLCEMKTLMWRMALPMLTDSGRHTTRKLTWSLMWRSRSRLSSLPGGVV